MHAIIANLTYEDVIPFLSFSFNGYRFIFTTQNEDSKCHDFRV